MKKHLFAAALIVTLGMAAGCGAEGVSGDVITSTVEQEAEELTGENVETAEAEEVMSEAEVEESVAETADVMTESVTATETVVDDPEAPAATDSELLSSEAVE